MDITIQRDKKDESNEDQLSIYRHQASKFNINLKKNYLNYNNFSRCSTQKVQFGRSTSNNPATI